MVTRTNVLNSRASFGTSNYSPIRNHTLLSKTSSRSLVFVPKRFAGGPGDKIVKEAAKIGTKAIQQTAPVSSSMSSSSSVSVPGPTPNSNSQANSANFSTPGYTAQATPVSLSKPVVGYVPFKSVPILGPLFRTTRGMSQQSQAHFDKLQTAKEDLKVAESKARFHAEILKTKLVDDSAENPKGLCKINPVFASIQDGENVAWSTELAKNHGDFVRNTTVQTYNSFSEFAKTSIVVFGVIRHVVNNSKGHLYYGHTIMEYNDNSILFEGVCYSTVPLRFIKRRCPIANVIFTELEDNVCIGTKLVITHGIGIQYTFHGIFHLESNFRPVAKRFLEPTSLDRGLAILISHKKNKPISPSSTESDIDLVVYEAKKTILLEQKNLSTGQGGPGSGNNGGGNGGNGII